MTKRVSITTIQVSTAVVIALAWEIIGRSSNDIFFVLGSPSAILTEFWKLLIHEELLFHCYITGSEALVGLLIGTVVGSSIGLSLWYSDTVAKVSKPFVIAVGTLPVFAFAPLMIVWFGIGFKMKVAMAAFSTVFVAFNLSRRGASSVAQGYIDVLRGMDATRRQIFRKVVLPSAMESVLASMRLNVGFALLGAFIGEFISSQHGLGYVVLRAAGLYNVPRAFAAAIGITALALTLDGMGALVEHYRFKLVQWITVPNELWSSSRRTKSRDSNR